jgi:hypothetical protein
MAVKPILFSGPMVRAILAGHKTQTRRVIKPQPADDIHAVSFLNPNVVGWESSLHHRYGNTTAHIPDYQPGDIIWVRESWLPDPPCDGDWPDVEFYGCGASDYSLIPDKLKTPRHCLYRASWDGSELKWKPSIHMPKWACRIFLKVTDVRAQKVKDITERDAVAEGCPVFTTLPHPVNQFVDLWDSINAKRGFGIADNPWVWAYTFERTEKPADWPTAN